ncbi:class I SAM-dependent DNA methyltransferase [Actinocrispum wychmicini]|nr:class I SAM-dependent DNA methyltransferase [Actinocrispum wychmicini]
MDSLFNVGEYVSAHYLAEVMPKTLKSDRLPAWAKREKAGEPSPRTQLRALRQPFFAARAQLDQGSGPFSPSWRSALDELHCEKVLASLGFDAVTEPMTITVEHSGAEHEVAVLHHERDVVVIACGWATDLDAALDSAGAGRLPQLISLSSGKELATGADLASFLFGTEKPPRYVLILVGAIVILADRHAWSEGRYLAANLDTALGRNDTSLAGELDIIAALFSAEALHSPDSGENPLSSLVDAAQKHAVGVSDDLRTGLQRSVELIANEVLDRIRDANVQPEQLDDVRALARTLTRESLRYLYRILFLLYAEARPELGVLPADYPEYAEGYGMARLGELVTHPLVDEAACTGFHLYESLDLLFSRVNKGYRPRLMGEGSTSADEGIRFEPLNSDLFGPERITLIGVVKHPDWDEDQPEAVPEYIDTRLRNETLHQVLHLLMIVRGKKKERGGFISYAQLGINQLGAVYEGLMSYTGFIAAEELYEVAKGGDPSGGGWMIPAAKADQFQDNVFVTRDDDETGDKRRVRYPAGSFVYRLAGRDRQTSASYYTPESLTKVTVQLALKQRIEENPVPVKANDLLRWRICEPALGSGAFLNEAINQVATEYLRRKKEELDEDIPLEEYDTRLRQVKAYIALHNGYGVDLNETAVELAEVSLWLNVMHPGLAAPWFGLHLRRGNSLIGASRRYYSAEQLPHGDWLRSKDTLPPTDLPFRDGALPDRAVHQFLLPAIGWGAVAGEKEARALAPEAVAQLAAWRKRIHHKPKKGKQTQRLQALARRTEFLWDLVIQRLEISEREISRRIDVWGAEELDHPHEAVDRQEVYDDLHAEGTPYWRLKTLMNTWCALWFWPVHQAGLLNGTASIYPDSRQVAEQTESAELTEPAEAPVPVPFAEQTSLLPLMQESLFGEASEVEARPFKQPRAPKVRRRPVVPLSGLDDWLEFAEALLGTSDLGEGHLYSDITTLRELDELEHDLPSQMGMDNEFLLPQRFPWLSTVEDLAERHGFFHWELDFAHIFKAGGFDLQLGNPPWVRPRWEENTVLAELDPWFKLAENPAASAWRDRKSAVLYEVRAQQFFLSELASQVGLAEYLGSPATYELLVGTQPDLYRAFMIRTWANLGLCGTAGLLHPDTHFGGDKERRLRAEAYARLRVHGDFVNAGNRFFPPPVNRSSHFGLHVYGRSKKIGFSHLSWLFGASVLTDSLAADTKSEDRLVGVRVDGAWDVQAHRSRVINVDREMLSAWARLTGETGIPVEQAKLLYPVSRSEDEAIVTLGGFGCRLADVEPRISRGYDEANAKKDGLIEWWIGQSDDWSDVILKGPQLGVATPFFKQPPNTGTGARPQDLTELPVDAVPGTSYRCIEQPDGAAIAQDRWVDHRALAELLASAQAVEKARFAVAEQYDLLLAEVTDEQIEAHLRELSKRPYTDFYRVAWRRRIADDTDRSLFAALIPPGPAHVHAVHSMALSDNRETALTAGFWAAMPLDYLLRATATKDLQPGAARFMPASSADHVLASGLLLRTLRLNCLTAAYAPLWTELFDIAWPNEQWAATWPGLAPLGKVTGEWGSNTPLRTERERRAALVEVDALVAVWLGLTANHLEAIYRSRYPILSDYEDVTWFDADGRKIAGNWNTFGHGQTKEHYQQLMAYLEDSEPPPTGYRPPFYKADRVAEMQLAHAVFSKRLEESR